MNAHIIMTARYVTCSMTHCHSNTLASWRRTSIRRIRDDDECIGTVGCHVHGTDDLGVAKMKEMKYSREWTFEVLAHGNHEGYEYYILNLGHHPCAYVVLGESDKLYGKEYEDIESIECHGGLTYSRPYLGDGKIMLVNRFECKWILGWDYAHAGDYAGYYDGTRWMNDENYGKKWTTIEILDDVKDVIRQLRRLNDG